MTQFFYGQLHTIKYMDYTFGKYENNLIRFKFIFALLVSLKCSMDVQTSDGRGMLLKYVTSYVTKMQDRDIINGIVMLKFETDSLLLLPFFSKYSSYFEGRHKLHNFCLLFNS